MVETTNFHCCRCLVELKYKEELEESLCLSCINFCKTVKFFNDRVRTIVKQH